MLAYIASRRMAAGVQQAAEQATGEAADEAADQHRTPLREMIEIGIDDAEVDAITEHGDRRQRGNDDEQQQIGRASRRERVCQYVYILVADVAIKIKNNGIYAYNFMINTRTNKKHTQ